ncbi:hypothetical protein ABZU32_14855 [Sphaerisporangium sp. NPDC005288]|uniref:hypothetical protein n=1 Tax=Sphaerisporangium sp. NPDC005288 TaxID=3155114 RepID=UPI0033B5E44B
MTSTPPRGARRRRPVLIPAVAVLAAATAGVSAALGGLAQAPDTSVEKLGKGAEFDQGKMLTVVQDAVVRSGGKFEMGVPGKRYLQIVLKVTNETDRTIQAQEMDHALPTVRADSTTIKPKPGDLGPYIRSISQGHSYAQLHPGVPTTVIMSFELEPGRPVPKRLSIDLGAFELHEDFFSRQRAWSQIFQDTAVTPSPAASATPAPSPSGTDAPRLGLAEPKTRIPPVVAAQVDLPVRVETS